MRINATQEIVERVVQFQTQDISKEVFHQTKRCILDYCGVVLAGAKYNAEKNARYLDSISFAAQSGTVSLFGMNRKADIYSAALVNGMNAHVIELDDGHRFGMMHMGAPIISAVFAVAEGKGISGEKILRAIICGYEIAITLARHMQPGHKLKGYHATGTCCTVGGAMAVALLLDFNREQIQGALSAAATSAAGLLEVIDDASQLKPYNIGRAAMDAVAAAMIGRAGFCGPDDVIGGKRGFFAALASAEDYQKICELPTLFSDDTPAITEIYTKPYAACRHCHPAIEAALSVREQMQGDGVEISDDTIESICVSTYKLAIAGHDHTEICGVSSAKMSTPYSVAAALGRGLVGIGAYEQEILTDDCVQRLAKKVAVKFDEELDKLSPQKRAAIAQVSLCDGSGYRARVDYPRGEPENRMEDRELEEKFEELASIGGKTADEIQEIKRMIWDYTEQANSLFERLL